MLELEGLSRREENPKYAYFYSQCSYSWLFTTQILV